MAFDTTEYTELRHIERIVWKPINWPPESPDEYIDGVPPLKQEMMIAPISGTDSSGIVVSATQFAHELSIHSIRTSNDRDAVGLGIRVGTIPADLARDVVDAILELHRVATNGEPPAMEGIERIDWKQTPASQSTRQMTITRPETNHRSPRFEISVGYDPAFENIGVRWLGTSSPSRYSDRSEPISRAGPRVAHGVLDIFVAEAPAVAYAILCIHRRTREHDYEGKDAGLRTDFGVR